MELNTCSQPTPKSVGRAVRARWILLGCYLVLTCAWYFVFLSESDPLGMSLRPPGILVGFLLATLVLFGAQFLLLLGAPAVHWPRPRRRRSIFVSLAAGAAIAVMLSLGIVFAGASLYKLIYHAEAFQANWSTVTINSTTAPATTTAPTALATPAPAAPRFDWRTDVPWTFVGIVLVAWTFWFLVFALVGGGQWSQRFRRMYRTLIAGTVLELLVTIPIDVQVRRRTSCYCNEGTFFALAVGLTAILWTFGPGVAIVFLIRHSQRMAETGRCLQCGYDLRGLENPRCPECGTPFRPASSSPLSA